MVAIATAWVRSATTEMVEPSGFKCKPLFWTE